MFLPHVQKVIHEASKKSTLEEKIQHIFSSLSGISIKPAKDLSYNELQSFAVFFNLLEPNNKKFLKVQSENKKRKTRHKIPID